MNFGKIIIGANLALLLFLGTRTVIKFPVWSPIDEGSHFNYVQFLAENKRLPILEKDYASWQVLSIAEGIYPEVTTTDPAEIGLGGYLYEAFQPPLYYLASIPTFLLGGGNFMNKITALRIQDLLLFAATLIFCWRISGKLFEDKKKRNIFRVTATFLFLMPGLLVRNITVSNAVLEFALAALFFYFLLIKENMWRSAITLGLLFLSRFTSIYLYGIFGLALAAKLLTDISIQKTVGIKTLGRFAALTAVPILMLAPWFCFNYANYDSFTANALAKEMQKDIVNPENEDYTLSSLVPMSDIMMDTFFLPEEWGMGMGKPAYWAVSFFKAVTFFVSLPATVLLIILRTFRENGKTLARKLAAAWEKSRATIISATWVILNILMLYAIIVLENWPTKIGRYIYPATLPLAYLITEAVDTLFRKEGRLLLLLLTEGFLLALWLNIAAAY